MADLLSERLDELAGAVEYPPTPAPALAAAVRARVEAAGVAPFSRSAGATRHTSRRVLVAAVVLALLGGGGVAVAALPGVRHALGDLLGLRGATVQRVPALPPAPAAAGDDVGERVSAGEAARRAGFALLAAHDARLGAPRAVYAAATAGGEARITLSYGGGVRLTQVRGRTEPDLVRKLTPRTTAVRRVLVRPGEPGIYVAGDHVVMYLDARGRVVADRARRAGRVLLWQRGPLLLRLEAGVSERRALQIARSVR